MGRKFNFNPGPTALPEPVLEKARDAIFDFRGIGTGIMEISHRSPEFVDLLEHTKETIRQLFGLDKDTHILFCQGGARTQFSMIPMNFLHTSGAYIDTGTWSASAIKEAELVGTTKIIASSEATQYDHIPTADSDTLDGDESYLHITSNNTIYGTQWHQWPDTNGVPLIVDMSSDIASRTVDINQFDMVYAGAQKNIGPAGVTLVLLKDSFAKKARDKHFSRMLRYSTYVDNNSLYNTPPVWNIFVVSLVLDWLQEQGGVPAIEKLNTQKSDLLYGLIDEQPDFFRGTVQKESRSGMNITFRLPTEDLEKKMVAEGAKAGFLGLKGHRIVGGIRVSNYNAVTLEGIEKLVEFMKQFASTHG